MLPRVLEFLERLGGTALVVCGYVAGPTVVPWVLILLHELAHAAAAWFVGVRVLQGFVGSGRHVLPVRWFGTRWELRLLPTHGYVLVHPPRRGFRTRMLCVVLAGPLASTAVAGVIVWLWLAQPPLHAVGSSMGIVAWKAALLTAMPVCVLSAAAAWLPLTWRHAGAEIPGDVEMLWQLLRADGAQVAAMAAASEEAAAAQETWIVFLDGRAEEALRRHRAVGDGPAPRFHHTFTEALYAWPVEGAVAALAVLERARSEFEAWRTAEEQRAQGSHEAAGWAKALRRHVCDWEKLFLVQRSFFGAVSGAADLLEEAAAASAEMLRRFPRDPAVQRTAGLVALHRGDVAAGMHLLRDAWLAAEPLLLRALTALYLAFGHALRHRHAEAQRWLRKCRRLHPQCVLLPEYEARIRAAAASSAASPGAAAG